MPYKPPVNQWYDVQNDDGSHYGWLDTYLQPSGPGTWAWAFHYRIGAKDAPPDMSTLCPNDDEGRAYVSGTDFPPGSGQYAHVVFPDPMPEPHPEGAVGYVDWPGQPRRWLVPAA